MLLQTKQIKQFLSLANPVQVNTIIPILSYIKLESGTLTKTNMNTYVVHKIDAPAEQSLLLDEKVLSAFLKECKSETIEVKAEGNKVWLIEGKRKMQFQSAELNNFPKPPDAAKEDFYEFKADVLSALGVAAKNTASTGLSSAFDYVHLKDDYVITTDNHKFFCYQAEGIPNMVMTTECANIISQFQDVVYYKNGRYDFFEMGDTLYGFIQTETKTPNFSKVIPKKQSEQYLDINASEFIGFCDTVNAIGGANNKMNDCELKGKKLRFFDPELDIDYSIELNAEGDFEPDVTFRPKLFGGFFKSLGISTIRLCDSGLGNKSLSVWDLDDRFFSGLVVGTIPE